MELPFGNEYFKIGKFSKLLYLLWNVRHPYTNSDKLLEFCAVNVKKLNKLNL